MTTKACENFAGGLYHASATEISAMQDKLLRSHITFLAANSPYYRAMFRESGLQPDEIVSAKDLVRLPFTCKSDIENHYDAFMAVGMEAIADICLTSGTTGTSIAMLQSADDLERLAINEELAFRAAGFSSSDRVLIAVASDRCFMAGLAYFLGLTRIKATVIRAGSGTPGLTAEMIRNLRPTALVGVPSLLLNVAERLQSKSCQPSDFGISRIVCIGEPIREPDFTLSSLGMRLEELWRCQIFGTYASTEMATSFTECSAGTGGHLLPELIITEIVDDAGYPVPAGEFGEVVATPLGVTGMPLLRFKTGDIAALYTEPCTCGRNSPRISPIVGRKSQMLKYQGTTVYPPAIFTVLQGIEAISGSYIEVESDYTLSDRIRVVVGSRDSSLRPAMVAEHISAAIRVKPEVVIVPPEEIVRVTTQEDKRKPVIFFDKRNK